MSIHFAPEAVAPVATPFGHNEMAVRLGILASDAQVALDRVAKGEGNAIDGWLAYGAALNEGRALFNQDDDKGFGQWVADNVHRQLVGVEPNDHERAAAMWAAANPSEFAEARAAGNARTVRGIHAKWNEISAERVAAEARAAAEEALVLFKALRTELTLAFNLAGYEWHRVPDDVRSLIDSAERHVEAAKGDAGYIARILARIEVGSQ